MSEHLGLLEMSAVLGIGIVLVVVELVRTHSAIGRDKRAPPTSRADGDHNDDATSR